MSGEALDYARVAMSPLKAAQRRLRSHVRADDGDDQRPISLYVADFGGSRDPRHRGLVGAVVGRHAPPQGNATVCVCGGVSTHGGTATKSNLAVGTTRSSLLEVIAVVDPRIDHDVDTADSRLTLRALRTRRSDRPCRSRVARRALRSCGSSRPGVASLTLRSCRSDRACVALGTLWSCGTCRAGVALRPCGPCGPAGPAGPAGPVSPLTPFWFHESSISPLLHFWPASL